jgi:hypothetical protein
MTVSEGSDLSKAYKASPISFCLHRGYGFRARAKWRFHDAQLRIGE